MKESRALIIGILVNAVIIPLHFVFSFLIGGFIAVFLAKEKDLKKGALIGTGVGIIGILIDSLIMSLLFSGFPGWSVFSAGLFWMSLASAFFGSIGGLVASAIVKGLGKNVTFGALIDAIIRNL